MSFFFLNESLLHPKYIQFLKNLNKLLINLVKRISNKKLDVAAGKINYGVGPMCVKFKGRSGGSFPLGNYWHPKEYKFMWPDDSPRSE